MGAGSSRRAFLAAAAAVVLPRVPRAQPVQKRVGALIGANPDDPVGLGFADAIRTGLAEQGWIDGSNVHVEVRFNSGNADLSRQYAAELMALGQDAFVCGTNLNAFALQEVTQTIPIVFVALQDPVALGLVRSYARPGGNMTGFTNFEPSHGSKFVGLLMDLAPQLTRVAMMFNPETATNRGAFILPYFYEGAAAYGLEPLTAEIRSVEEIEPAVAALAAGPPTGIVVGNNTTMFVNRPPILAAINGHRIPAVYPFQNYADEGGLIAYAVNTHEVFRRGGALAGRILNGAHPADLPVQSPTSFVLVVNLRTAREQGIVVPMHILAAADRVVE
ncbi:MAG: ABC transporter substrate-binding protein [Bauldia sp.]